MLGLTGLGKVRPNTLVLGFKNDWQNVHDDKVDEYVNIIKDAFELKYGVAILRVNDNLEMAGEDEDSSSGDEEVRKMINYYDILSSFWNGMPTAKVLWINLLDISFQRLLRISRNTDLLELNNDSPKWHFLCIVF